MKDLVYPAVVFKDNERGTNTGWYSIYIPDLAISTEGETIIDAFTKAKHYLCSTIDCAIKFDCEINAPSDYEEVLKQSREKAKDDENSLFVTVILVDGLH